MSAEHARQLLDAKLALEAELIRPITEAGLAYLRAWEFGRGHVSVMDRMAHQESIESLLRRHYARVVMVMQGRRPPKNPTLEDACRSFAQIERLTQLAKRNAGLILRTLDRELSVGMAGAPEIPDDGLGLHAKSLEFKDGPPTPTVSYWARLKATVAHVTAKFKSRVGTVANNNTNPIAEDARRVEIEIVAPKEANGRLFKTWMSLMDGRERPAHHDAHEQRQPAAGEFTVGGELLRFPGDTSLGASLAQTINCRCYLVWSHVNTETGAETPIYQTPSAPTRKFRKPKDTKPPILKPTSQVTLNGKTRGEIVLDDLSIAKFRQPTPHSVEVLKNGKVIARATIENGRAANVVIDKPFQATSLRRVIERSIENSSVMDRRPHAERLPH